MTRKRIETVTDGIRDNCLLWAGSVDPKTFSDVLGWPEKHGIGPLRRIISPIL